MLANNNCSDASGDIKEAQPENISELTPDVFVVSIADIVNIDELFWNVCKNDVPADVPSAPTETRLLHKLHVELNKLPTGKSVDGKLVNPAQPFHVRSKLVAAVNVSAGKLVNPEQLLHVS